MNHSLRSCLAVAVCVAASAPFAATVDRVDIGAAPQFVGAPVGPRTRADVRDELMRARVTGTMTPGGEIGDSQQVMEARETFAELQREVVSAHQALSGQQHQQALARR